MSIFQLLQLNLLVFNVEKIINDILHKRVEGCGIKGLIPLENWHFYSFFSKIFQWRGGPWTARYFLMEKLFSGINYKIILIFNRN